MFKVIFYQKECAVLKAGTDSLKRQTTSLVDKTYFNFSLTLYFCFLYTPIFENKNPFTFFDMRENSIKQNALTSFL